MINPKLRVLLCDKNEDLSFMIGEYLKRGDLEVDQFNDSKAGYEASQNNTYNIYIFDVTLFEKNGLEMIDKVHAANPEAVVVLLKPRSIVLDRLYVENEIILSKPFGIHDLVSAIGTKKRSKTNLLKGGSVKSERLNAINTTTYMIGNYKFEVQRFKLTLNNQTRELTTKEAALLLLIAENPNCFVERDFILEKIWKTSNADYGAKRSMDVYLCKLRQYLKDDPSIYIINIHGKGYKFIAPVELV